MACVVERPGRKNLYVVYWQGGRQVWRSTGTDDRGKAERMAAEVAAISAGRQDRLRLEGLLVEAGADLEGLAPRVRVADVWGVFLEQGGDAGMSGRTLDSKRMIVEKWMDWMGKRYPVVEYVDEVTDRMAGEYMMRFAERAGVTHNNNLSGLRSTFGVIRLAAGLKRNVWDGIRRRRKDVVSKRSLTVGQVRTLLEKGREFGGRVPGFWPVAIALGYHTGLRWGDVCTLEWSEVNWEDEHLELLPAKTRGRRGVLLTPWFHDDWSVPLQALRSAVCGGGFVWPVMADAHRKQAGWPHEEWREICKRAGIEVRRDVRKGEKRARGDVTVVGFHSLRHTYVTLLDEAGVSLDDIRATAGHGSTAVTKIYNHSKASWERVAGKLPGLG